MYDRCFVDDDGGLVVFDDDEDTDMLAGIQYYTILHGTVD
jgi:hypothetical protein